ncbi:hypothetical protein S83_066294, partial [Arachis hypogaea]
YGFRNRNHYTLNKPTNPSNNIINLTLTTIENEKLNLCVELSSQNLGLSIPQTNELYQLSSVAFCLLVAWLLPKKLEMCGIKVTLDSCVCAETSLIFTQFNPLQGPIRGFLQLASIVDFSSNNFSSVIPVEIGYYMSRMLYLSLANNSFHGSIPHSLCNASMLEVLDLSHNKISGELPHCLMKTCETLWILNLGNNNLT